MAINSTKKINRTIYFKNPTVALYVLNIVKFYTNWILFTIWLIHLFFMHNFLYYKILKFKYLIDDITIWCCTKSVGWTLRLRWTTSGCGRPTIWIQNQKGGRSEPTKHPPIAKLVSQGWNSNLFQESSVQEISYHHSVQTSPLYRDLGVVISSVTSPRSTKAQEFGYNFLNG